MDMRVITSNKMGTPERAELDRRYPTGWSYLKSPDDYEYALNINGSVHIMDGQDMRYNFRRVSGSFIVMNALWATDYKHTWPSTVGGNLVLNGVINSCAGLDSIKVKGTIDISSNEITSLNGLGSTCGGLNASLNPQLISYAYGPGRVDGDIDLSLTNLKNLEHMPIEIPGKLTIPAVDSLQGMPLCDSLVWSCGSGSEWFVRDKNTTLNIPIDYFNHVASNVREIKLTNQMHVNKSVSHQLPYLSRLCNLNISNIPFNNFDGVFDKETHATNITLESIHGLSDISGLPNDIDVLKITWYPHNGDASYSRDLLKGLAGKNIGELIYDAASCDIDSKYIYDINITKELKNISMDSDQRTYNRMLEMSNK